MVVSWLFLPKVTVVRLVQSSKAHAPMVVTLFGMVTLIRLVQPSKAQLSMLVTLSGMVMLVRLVQSSKADLPMLVSWLLLPKVTVVRLVQ